MLPYRIACLAAFAVLASACSRAVDSPAPPVAVTSPARAPAAPRATPSEATEILRNAHAFEDTQIGYGGELSRYVAAFRVVLASAGAKDAFHALVDEATPAGRLYGAAGLYFADPPAFDDALARLSAAGGDVRRQQGCSIDQEKIAAVIRSAERNRIEVPKGQTLAAWLTAHPDGGHCDLAGGCMPLSFVDPPRAAPRAPSPI